MCHVYNRDAKQMSGERFRLSNIPEVDGIEAGILKYSIEIR